MNYSCTSTKGAPLQIRLMTAADLDAVLAMETAAHSHPWSRGNFQDSLNAGNQCWLAELRGQPEPAHAPQRGRPAGYLILSCGGDEAELLNITVAPQFHRQGIGQCLLTFAIANIQSRADTLFLEVRESNHAAIQLYEGLGFNQVGVRPGYYPAESGREDALIMAKFLDVETSN